MTTAAASRLKPLVQRQGTVGRSLLLATACSYAAYITPEQAGFHHCVLIYDSERRSPDDLAPHVAHLDAAGKPDQWLFDAFLYVPAVHGPTTGASYHTGPTNRTDWQALLDGWFAEGHGFQALRDAVAQASETLGDPPRPIRAIVTIPYPSAQQTDFGDVTGDGVSEDLSQIAGREAVVKWYVDEALKRWRSAKLDELELWGLYWVNEGLSANDAPIAQRAAQVVHERGYRFLWIPWFRAPGFRLWREVGFDVAILQPNYAFLSQHLGKVRSDRLIETATLAESLGMGVEMEIGFSPERDLREREMFREYLAFGAPSACDYQAAATAYYQGHQAFPDLCRSPDPDARRVYDEIAAYVRGEATERPGRLTGAKVALSPDGTLGDLRGPSTTITVELPEPRPVGEVEINVVRGEAPWSGLISADLRSPDGDRRPTGWVRAVVPARDEDARWRHVVAVPLFADAVEAFRLHVTPGDPAAVLRIGDFTVTCGQPRLDWPELSLATGRPYRVEPDFPRKYPDTGTLLTNGEGSTEGWMQGRSVGWWGDAVTVQLDLGAVNPVERIVAHCDGGGHAAVQFPEGVVAELATREPPVPPNASGLGPAPPLPEATVAINGSDVHVDGERPIEGDDPTAWGHYELPLATPTPARFIALYFPHRAWLMLSEIEVWARGRNVAPSGRYSTMPYPSGTEDARYADDGVLLTDGYIARGFLPERIAGWSHSETITVTLDLGGAREIRQVVAHTLGGGLYSIGAPPKVAVELSDDSRTFRPIGSATAQDPADQTCVDVPLAVLLPQPEQARFVRVLVEPSSGWTMLTEVVVR